MMRWIGSRWPRQRTGAIAAVLGVVLGAALAVGVAAPARAGAPYPAPSGRCVDTSGVLGGELCGAITRVLLDDEKASRDEIAVAVVPTTGGDPIAAWATGLFNTWGVGKRGENNGVLLVVAVKDHQLRIVTGDGARARLTDAGAARIIATTITPAFRAERYAGGVLAGLDAIRAALGHPVEGAKLAPLADRAASAAPPAGAASSGPDTDPKPDGFDAGGLWVCIAVLGGLLVLVLAGIVIANHFVPGTLPGAGSAPAGSSGRSPAGGGRKPVRRSKRGSTSKGSRSKRGTSSTAWLDSRRDWSGGSSWSSGDSGSSGSSFGGGDSSGGGSSGSW
jgi:uncharacterized protein